MANYSIKLALLLGLMIGLFFAYDYYNSPHSFTKTDIDIDKLKEELVQTNSTLSIAFNPKNSQEVILSTREGHVYLWNFNNDKVTPFTGYSSKVYDTKISPDNLLIASAEYYNKTVRIWDAKTKKELQLLSFDEKPTKIAFSPDSHYLAIGFYIEPNTAFKQDLLVYDVVNKKRNTRSYTSSRFD